MKWKRRSSVYTYKVNPCGSFQILLISYDFCHCHNNTKIGDDDIYQQEEENVPKPSSLQSITGGEKSTPDDGLPRLDQVLNEKKLVSGNRPRQAPMS